MSVRVMAAAWSVKHLKPVEKLVLMALADFADDAGRCWPAMQTLADKCDMTDRGVRGIVRRLESRGLVRTVEARGRTRSNHYTVTIKPEHCSDYGPDKTGTTAQKPERGADFKPVKPERHDIKTGTAVPPNHQEPRQKDRSRKGGASSSSQAKGSRLPDDWQLTRELGRWALDQGMAEDQVRIEADKFRDYWRSQPGQRGRKSDWSATWRNWIRKALEMRPAKPSRMNGGRKDDRLARILARAEAQDRASGRTPPDGDMAGTDADPVPGDLFSAGRERPGVRGGAGDVEGRAGGPAEGRDCSGDHGPAALPRQAAPDPGRDPDAGAVVHFPPRTASGSDG